MPPSLAHASNRRWGSTSHMEVLSLRDNRYTCIFHFQALDIVLLPLMLVFTLLLESQTRKALLFDASVLFEVIDIDYKKCNHGIKYRIRYRKVIILNVTHIHSLAYRFIPVIVIISMTNYW